MPTDAPLHQWSHMLSRYFHAEGQAFVQCAHPHSRTITYSFTLKFILQSRLIVRCDWWHGQRTLYFKIFKGRTTNVLRLWGFISTSTPMELKSIFILRWPLYSMKVDLCQGLRTWIETTRLRNLATFNKKSTHFRSHRIN